MQIGKMHLNRTNLKKTSPLLHQTRTFYFRMFQKKQQQQKKKQKEKQNLSVDFNKYNT